MFQNWKCFLNRGILLPIVSHYLVGDPTSFFESKADPNYRREVNSTTGQQGPKGWRFLSQEISKQIKTTTGTSEDDGTENVADSQEMLSTYVIGVSHGKQPAVHKHIVGYDLSTKKPATSVI